MRNKLKFTLIIISLAILFPIKVFASDFTTALGGNKTINANDSFSVTLSVNNAQNLMTFDTSLNYDKNKLEYLGFSAQSGFTVSVSSAIAGYGSPKSGSFPLVTLNFRAKESLAPGQNTIISIAPVTAANADAVEMSGTGCSASIYVAVPKSTNNNLSSLSVNGVAISGFNAGKTSYTIADTIATTINITATAEDAKASISGIGTLNVNYGKNTFNVVVTAENGAKKTYNIIVTRPDHRSQDNSLSSLSAKPLDLKFNKNTTNYSFKVEHNVSSININAKANDSKATVSGTGTKTLKDYVNTFNVVVTAENGGRKTYTIKVIRKDAEGNLGAVSKDNTLKKLTVEGYDIKFNKDTLDYSIEVDNLVDNIKVTAVVNDKTATYEIVGNTNFSVGTNTVKINVTAENGDVKSYIINVTRKSDAPSTTLKELNTILEKITANEVIIEIKDENTVLNKDILNIMSDSKKQFIINNYNDSVINYIWLIDGKNIKDVDSIDTSIKFNSDNLDKINKLSNYADSMYLNFVHDGEVPEGTKIKIYVGDKYQDNDKVNVYYYNEDKNRMDKIALDVVVIDGYVEFEIEHCSEYIITRAVLEQKSIFNIFTVIAIVEFVVILGYVGYNLFKKNKAINKKIKSK